MSVQSHYRVYFRGLRRRHAMRSITKSVAGSVTYAVFVIVAFGILTGINWYQDLRHAHFPPPPNRT